MASELSEFSFFQQLIPLLNSGKGIIKNENLAGMLLTKWNILFKLL